jgi:RND family efflux transporter MFP subunit
MNPKRKRFYQLVISITLIIVGVIVMIVLTASKPELKKGSHSAPVPMVRVMEVETKPRAVTVRGEGTVQPLREIDLVSQVGGKIILISPALVNGGEFSEGDKLLSIDPVDYELAVTLAKAKVKDSESNLKIIQEEALVAKEEWRVHHTGNFHTRKEPPPLVAKEPQLAAARAKLDADRADLKKALLNLERTVFKAPFNGLVSKKLVDVGQYVSPGQAVAKIFATEAVEIPLPLEDKTLFWFDVPGFTPGDSPGSFATVRSSIAGREIMSSGRVVRAEGKLDEKTRMITVVVRVDRPYAKKPPLAIGLFVTVDIEGHILPDAAVIPRAALHQGNIVWVVNGDGILKFRNVKIARYQGEGILIESGLSNGEFVVISPLKAVTDGMTVRTAIAKESNSK